LCAFFLIESLTRQPVVGRVGF